MPFKWAAKKKDLLQSTLFAFFREATPFKIKLNNFDVFPPKVIYVVVQPEPVLTLLQKDLGLVMARKLAIHNVNYRNRQFHPHITVAFRDLKKARFIEAWDYYQSQSFTAEFQVNRISLLKHNGRIWEQEIHFHLGK